MRRTVTTCCGVTAKNRRPPPSCCCKNCANAGERRIGRRGLPRQSPGLSVDRLDRRRELRSEQWALFDAGLSLAGMRFLRTWHSEGSIPPRSEHDLDIGRIKPRHRHDSRPLVWCRGRHGRRRRWNRSSATTGCSKTAVALSCPRRRDGLNDLPPLPAKSLKTRKTTTSARGACNIYWWPLATRHHQGRILPRRRH